MATAKPSLTIKRKLKAPPRLVFSAWTDPARLVHWFGPAPTVLGSVEAHLDVRVGGRFRVSFTTEDGEYHEVGGMYQEVVPDQKLVFSWAWHSTPEREVACHGVAEEGGGRHAAHAAPRAVLRSEGTRRPRVRLDRHHGQAGGLRGQGARELDVKPQ